MSSSMFSLEFQEEYNALSSEQQFIFQQFRHGQNLFISGPGGSGKSHLIRLFYQYLVEEESSTIGSKKKKVQITSTTGCSAVLLSDNLGKPVVKTIHSWAGIGIAKGPNEEIIARALLKRECAKSWKQVNVLIIDEVSMLSKKLFTILDTLGKKHRQQPHLPFGGIQVICLGDMYQLPPVQDMYDEASGQFCFESEQWQQTFLPHQHVQLTHIYRQSDPLFRETLNEVRLGQLSKEKEGYLRACLQKSTDTLVGTSLEGMIPMKILPTCAKVKAYNEYQYDMVEAMEHPYKWNVVTNYPVDDEISSSKPSMSSYLSLSTSSFPKRRTWKDVSKKEQEMILMNFTKTVPVDDIVRLKIGVPVMCLVNLDLEEGISNGSMGMVIGFETEGGGGGGSSESSSSSSVSSMKQPIVKFSNGCIKSMGVHVWQHTEFPNVAIGQVPLRLSYSSTIHKLQGCTLDLAEMDLGGSIFETGQSYVALSRVKSFQGLFLTAFDPKRIRIHPKVEMFYDSFPSMTTIMEEYHETYMSSQPLETITTQDIHEDDTERKPCHLPHPKKQRIVLVKQSSSSSSTLNPFQSFQYDHVSSSSINESDV